MHKMREGKIYHTLVEKKGIEEMPARNAAPVAVYLYRSSLGEEGYQPLQVQRQGQIWRGMKNRNIDFCFEGISDKGPFAMMSPDERIEEEFDCIGIGLEVLASIGWVQPCDGFKASLTGKGLREIEKGGNCDGGVAE